MLMQPGLRERVFSSFDNRLSIVENLPPVIDDLNHKVVI
jgi:hypothetical protein